MMLTKKNFEEHIKGTFWGLNALKKNRGRVATLPELVEAAHALGIFI